MANCTAPRAVRPRTLPAVGLTSRTYVRYDGCMETALATLDRLAADLAAVELDTLPGDLLGVFAVALGRGIDRLTAFHAKVVHAADDRKVWTASGARDVDDWLSARTGTSRGTAIARRKLGEALEQCKTLDDAVASGELSAEAAVQLHDAITNPPEGADTTDVDDLIDAVKDSGPRDARAAAERWREIRTNETAEERSQRRYARRSVTSQPAVDGLVTSTLVLPELEHRQVMNAITHAAGDWCADDDRTHSQRLADGLINLAQAYASGTVTGGREKPTLLISCTAETITGLSDEPGWTAHGDRIPADVIRHLAENAILRRVVTAGNTILDLGTRVRYATHDQYQALMMRDGGCRYPGCTIPAAWCEIDHLLAWEDGGPTDMDNLAMCCTHHHHEKHRPGVTVLGHPGEGGNLRLRLADGTIINCPPHGRTTQAAA